MYMYMQASKSSVYEEDGWCEYSLDLAQTDGRVLVVSLVLDDDELDLVARTQVDAVVNLRHVKEQLLALHRLVVQEPVLALLTTNRCS